MVYFNCGELSPETKAGSPLIVVYSCLTFFVTPWTVTHQAPLSTGFPRQEYWNRFPFPSPGYLPDKRIKPGSLELQVVSLPTEPPSVADGNPITAEILPLPNVTSFHFLYRCQSWINILHPKLHYSICFWRNNFVTVDTRSGPGKSKITRDLEIRSITVFVTGKTY